MSRTCASCDKPITGGGSTGMCQRCAQAARYADPVALGRAAQDLRDRVAAGKMKHKHLVGLSPEQEQTYRKLRAKRIPAAEVLRMMGIEPPESLLAASAKHVANSERRRQAGEMVRKHLRNMTPEQKQEYRNARHKHRLTVEEALHAVGFDQDGNPLPKVTIRLRSAG